MGFGSKIDRRKFLRYVAAGSCGAACHRAFMPGSMLAYAAPTFGKISRIIEVFFYGGYCSYGFMPQHNNGARAKYPTLFRTPDLAAPIQNGHPDISLHQAFQGLVTEAGQHIALVLGAGNQQFSRSHEDAQNANQRVDLDPSRGNGMGVGAAIMAAIGTPFAGIAFGGTSEFMTGGPITARSVNSLENAGLPDFYQSDWYNMAQGGIHAGESAPKTAEQKLVGDAIMGMESSLATLENLGDIVPDIAYPNTTIGNNFADINRMIKGGVGNIFFVPYGGFDTHSNQAGQHQTLFGQLSAALVAFVQNLKLIPDPQGGSAWEHTAVITRTDFGRTIENRAFGTDHGMMHHQMVLGGSINGGVYGDPLTEAQFNNVNDYYGTSYIQFSAGEAIKELVEIGMGINAGFPVYAGNRYAPLGFI